MDYENFGALDASVQEKLDGDTDFQATLADLSDEDKNTAISTRKSELLDEEIKTLSSGSKKSKELADNYKVRAEKAERDLKNKPNGEGNSSTSDLSSKDVIFLAKADIHEDDMDEVLDWAKFKKVPVSEAYKQLKTTLQVRSEERKSANTANTGNARRGSSQATSEALISQARSGKIPESDEDIQRLVKAKMGIK